MKFGNFVADIFVIEHTKFGQDAFGFDLSIVHLGLQFFRGHGVVIKIFQFVTHYDLPKTHNVTMSTITILTYITLLTVGIYININKSCIMDKFTDTNITTLLHTTINQYTRIFIRSSYSTASQGKFFNVKLRTVNTLLT